MPAIDKLLKEKQVQARAADLDKIASATKNLAQVLGSRGTRWSPPAYRLVREAYENLRGLLAAYGRDYRDG